MRLFLIAIVSLYMSTAAALIDMRNANYSETWTDLKINGSGFDLVLERSYNSRTLFNGIYGFGWCYRLETKLIVSAEGSIKLTECGGGLSLEFFPKSKKSIQSVNTTVAKIMKEVKDRNRGQSKTYFSRIEKEIRKDHLLREEFVRQLNLNANAKTGSTYYAMNRSNESITFNGKLYTRKLADGTLEKYNKDGFLVQTFDKNRNFLKVKRKKEKILSVTDSAGRKLTFTYYPQSKHVKEIRGPRGLKATYKFEGEQLVFAKNAWNNVFRYKYDKLNNLTRITYPDKTTKKLTYNKEKDWVLSLTDRQECTESYNYNLKKKDLSYYKSSVVKKCGGKITNKSSFEFFHRLSSNGVDRYLYSTKSNRNGRKSEIVYHEIFGRPVSVLRNGYLTSYKYYDNGRYSGLVNLKKEPLKHTYFEYKNKCLKVSKAKTTYYRFKNLKRKKKKIKFKATTTNFAYNSPKCNLMQAKNSEGLIIALGYDRRGRITRIKDQTKKEVLIKYDSKFDKPSIVTRTGLGSIKVHYKKNGEIAKVDSKEGPSVAVQVASVFNNLLEVISPATSDVSI